MKQVDWKGLWLLNGMCIPGEQFARQGVQLDTTLACHAQDWKDVCWQNCAFRIPLARAIQIDDPPIGVRLSEV